MIQVQKSNDNCSNERLKDFELIIDKLQTLLNNQVEENRQLRQVASNLAGYVEDYDQQDGNTAIEYPKNFFGQLDYILRGLEIQQSSSFDVLAFLNSKI